MKHTQLTGLKNKSLVALLVLTSLLGLAWLIYHDSTQPPRFHASAFEQLDLKSAAQSIADQTVIGGAPGVILTIEKAGVSHSVVSGVANKSSGQAMPNNLPIRIGSVSKVYTATVVLLLAQEGLIDLDRKISDYLPENIISGLANADQATVRNLLMHTSGIPDYYSVSSYLLSDWTQEITLERTLPIAKGKSASQYAGDRFEYSNMGYILLGEIAEKVSGQSFSNLLNKLIYQPLDLRNTHYNVKHPSINGVHGYGTLLRPWADTYDWWEHSGPDGGLMATPNDVVVFLNALTEKGGALKHIGDMMLENLIPGEPGQMQGMGLHTIVSKSGAKLIGHTGDVFGYQTVAFAVPELDAVFVAHVNCDCAALSSSLIRNAYKAIVSSRSD